MKRLHKRNGRMYSVALERVLADGRVVGMLDEFELGAAIRDSEREGCLMDE